MQLITQINLYFGKQQTISYDLIICKKKNIVRIANAVQVATFYSEDKIDRKDFSTGR